MKAKARGQIAVILIIFPFVFLFLTSSVYLEIGDNLSYADNDSSPLPVFGNQHERVYYNTIGVCISRYVGIDISNQGESGDVFVRVTYDGSGTTYSEVFHMEANELVIAWLSVGCSFSGSLTWVTRAALPEDTSDGVLSIARPECKSDFTADRTEGALPFTVDFTEESSSNTWEPDYFWDFGDGHTSTERNPTHTYLDPGIYSVSLTVDCFDGMITETKADYIRVYSKEESTLHVPGQYPTIQAAIDAAHYGFTVLVADGIYKGEGNKNITIDGKAIIIRSENGAQNCIIDGEVNGRGFIFTNGQENQALLIGFTIQNCQISHEHGAGIYCLNSSPIISNCIIKNNVTLASGGGIGGQLSSPEIQYCLISNNTAYRGGGIFSPFAVCRRCTIVNNEATNKGGGIYFDNYGDDSYIWDSIVWGNIPDQTDITVLENIQVSHSDIQGGFDGEGNLNLDPLFVGDADYRLKKGSPCIDTGVNLPVSSFGGIDFDLRGGDAYIDGDQNGSVIADMGAYEYKPPPRFLPAIPLLLLKNSH